MNAQYGIMATKRLKTVLKIPDYNGIDLDDLT